MCLGHTYPYLRQHPVLVTAILAVAAKFFRTHLYTSLLSHAETLVHRSLARGDPSLTLIKALLVLVFWKAPSDKTAWVRSGTAIRLGYQLGLHRIDQHSAAQSESADAEESRDRQRTWFCAFVLPYNRVTTH